MLCSETDEGQAPLSLELLYHSAQVSGPGDAVVVAANLLMIETGFTPQVSRRWRRVGGNGRREGGDVCVCDVCVCVCAGQ